MQQGTRLPEEYSLVKQTLKNLATYLQDTLLPSRSVTLPYDELSDEEVGFTMEKLHKQFHKTIAGLQRPGLGQFVALKFMPRFTKSGGLPFVQIISIDDHWICMYKVNNKISECNDGH